MKSHRTELSPLECHVDWTTRSGRTRRLADSGLRPSDRRSLSVGPSLARYVHSPSALSWDSLRLRT